MAENNGVCSNKIYAKIGHVLLLRTLVVEKKPSTVKKFLQLGMDANSCDVTTGVSALASAIYEPPLVGSQSSSARRTVEIVKLLLHHGARPNHGAANPLVRAAKCGFEEIVKLLLDHGADVNGRFNSDDCTPLAGAARRGRLKIVELLLERGAERDNDALYEAIWPSYTSYKLNDRMNIVKLFLDRGFDANYATDTETVLCKAICWRSSMETVKLLLDYGARVDKKPRLGKYPLHVAVATGLMVDVTQMLLMDYGADINEECDGRTALAMAVDEKLWEETEVLVKHLVLIKSLMGSFVSEVNLNAAKGDFHDKCVREAELLMKNKFYDTIYSYLDVLKIKDRCKLAALASNEDVVQTFETVDFENEFPVYGPMIVRVIEKGASMNRDFELLKRFSDYLSSRDHDRLPKLPFTFISKLFTYLGSADMDTLRKL